MLVESALIRLYADFNLQNIFLMRCEDSTMRKGMEVEVCVCTWAREKHRQSNSSAIHIWFLNRLQIAILYIASYEPKHICIHLSMCIVILEFPISAVTSGSWGENIIILSSCAHILGFLIFSIENCSPVHMCDSADGHLFVFELHFFTLFFKWIDR